jgi:hypothetical protein
VLEEDEWHEDDEEDGSILGDKPGESRRLFKTVSAVRPHRPSKMSSKRID